MTLDSLPCKTRAGHFDYNAGCKTNSLLMA